MLLCTAVPSVGSWARKGASGKNQGTLNKAWAGQCVGTGSLTVSNAALLSGPAGSRVGGLRELPV